MSDKKLESALAWLSKIPLYIIIAHGCLENLLIIFIAHLKAVNLHIQIFTVRAKQRTEEITYIISVGCLYLHHPGILHPVCKALT